MMLPLSGIKELDELVSIAFALGMVYSTCELTPTSIDELDEAMTESILAVAAAANPFLLTAAA